MYTKRKGPQHKGEVAMDRSVAVGGLYSSGERPGQVSLRKSHSGGDLEEEQAAKPGGVPDRGP